MGLVHDLVTMLCSANPNWGLVSFLTLTICLALIDFIMDLLLITHIARLGFYYHAILLVSAGMDSPTTVEDDMKEMR